VKVELNASQAKAKEEIFASIIMRRFHLLTGYAGTGKTTLMQDIAIECRARGLSIVLTAPTHKAVSVLERKLKAARIEIPCQTIHSLLSLRPKPQGDKQIFVRSPHAKPVLEDIIIIDEASMLDQSMMTHIGRHLAARAVVFVGDPAQLPPVGEEISRAFDIVPCSHLDTIVRQAKGNPIIAAAAAIRASQGGSIDWSWAVPARAGNIGVFTPGPAADEWMRAAFTSQAFADDPDRFRYLCWTNARVAEVNARVRRWIHGRMPNTPFIPGERALIRSPLVIDNSILIATNEEVEVLDIAPATHWQIPAWGMKVRTEAGQTHDIHIPADDNAYRIRLGEFADAAKGAASSWEDYHEFKAAFINAQQIHALTIHNSQGSTFTFSFLDIPDVRKRVRDNLLEAQKLLYTGATRPTDGLILVGI
jgi:exodeoxyribonuclease-5